MLVMLNILSRFDLTKFPAMSVERLHLEAEAARIARAAGVPPPCAAQLPYNLTLREHVEAPAAVDALNVSGATVVASYALAGGALSGKYASSATSGRMARELANAESVNLLQGDFARGADYGERWREWRTAAVLAGVLLAVHLTAQAVQIHKANHESALLDGQMSQIFSIAMPADKMVDPRRQMQAQLDRIRRSGAGPQYFLHTLQVLGAAMASSPKAAIQSMSYREHSLEVKVTAPDLAALSTISQYVGKQGLSGEIKSSTPTASGIEANMQFRSPGAAGAHK